MLQCSVRQRLCDCLVSLGGRENKTRNIGKRMYSCDLGNPCVGAARKQTIRQLDEHVPGDFIINAIVSWNVLGGPFEASIPMRVRVFEMLVSHVLSRWEAKMMASWRSFSLGPSLQVSAARGQACLLERAVGFFSFVTSDTRDTFDRPCLLSRVPPSFAAPQDHDQPR